MRTTTFMAMAICGVALVGCESAESPDDELPDAAAQSGESAQDAPGEVVSDEVPATDALAAGDSGEPEMPIDRTIAGRLCPVRDASTGSGDTGGSDGDLRPDAGADGKTDQHDDGGGDGGGGEGEAEAPSDGGRCVLLAKQWAVEGAMHVAECSPVAYRSVPPSSGNHYDRFATYKEYDKPVAPGHLVHSLEHGAVELFYNCPNGCEAELRRVRAFINALPVDPLCKAPLQRRIILAPNPDLPFRWAAAAWGWTLTGSCFDEAAFGGFVKEHYAKTSENFCAPGVDRSTAGWCPCP